VKARLHYHRGQPCIVFLDSHGDALPVPDTRRAWRVTIYRRPKLAGER
jgi:hypothetical protein